MRRPVVCSIGLRVGLGVVALGLVLASPAAATWSVVATDSETGQVGVALASCVPAAILGDPQRPLVPVVVVPAKMAAATQGQLNAAAPARITELVAAGTEPKALVGGLIAPEFDNQAETRQHAVVSVEGQAAAFTGNELSPQALDRQGPSVSVQGNLLVSDQVVEAALAEFNQRREGGADLGAALVEGLLAGSRQGGDRRCPDQTALFAQLVVAQPDDAPGQPSTVLTVTVDQGDGQNPVALLATSQAAGRQGLIEAGQGTPTRGGAVVQVLVLIAALGMVVGGIVAFRRGIGSVRARK